MKNSRIVIFVFFLALRFHVSSQKSLQVIVDHFGKVKKYEIFIEDILEYKLKGDLFYRENKIANLQDSTVVFSNDSVIKLNNIKAIRIHRGGHLAKTFQEAFFIAGIGFIALNTTNNAINGTSPLIDSRAVYVSGALIGTSLLIRLFSTKHLRINKNKVLRINDIEFTKLNEK